VTSNARIVPAAFALGSVALAVGIACGPIEGSPLSRAPINACPSRPCESYDTDDRPRSQCTDGVCVQATGLPAYVSSVLVNVPDTSFYAPGKAFVLTRNDIRPSGVQTSRACAPPLCVQLPLLVVGEGRYRVTSQAARDVGFPTEIPDGTSLPVRVTFERLLEGTDTLALLSGLPIDPAFTSSRLVRKSTAAPTEVLYTQAVSLGRYARVLAPEPPYDAYFPPIVSTLPVTEPFIDDVTLGADKTTLDAPASELRRATIARIDGLDGWTTWLVDGTTGRRLSPARPLTGTTATVRLDTVGQSASTTGALREGVDIVVAPPPGSLAIPTFRSALDLTGTDLGTTTYPPLPPPASVSGGVAVPTDGLLSGVPARIVFTSSQIRLADGSSKTFLNYQTSVTTDGSGRFATVLPPGTYDVVVEPAEGTGFAKGRPKGRDATLDVAASRDDVRFEPTPRARASGRAVLTDGRPVADAEVRAIPSTRQPRGAVAPRPGRTRVREDGTFELELDPGQYDLAVDPQAGSGFPRVVTIVTIGASAAELGDIEVPPPIRFTVTLRDPHPSLAGNPIARAVVRVFAQPASDGAAPLVEVGRAMTDATGACEILLAQQPR